ASAIARRISGVGRVTVSERRSMGASAAGTAERLVERGRECQREGRPSTAGNGTLRKRANRLRSYTILRPPARKKGAPKAARARARPASAGEKAWAIPRAAVVR